MHFCGGPDDLVYLLMAIPFVGTFVAWVKMRLHHMTHHPGCELESREISPSNPEETKV
jgi:hypothetical protein